jgi:hypothetical protein
VTRRALADKAVGIAQLDTENLYIPGFAGLNLLRTSPEDANNVYVDTTWTTLRSFSFPKDSDGYFADAIRVRFIASARTSYSLSDSDFSVPFRVSVGGEVVLEIEGTVSRDKDYSAVVEVVMDASNLEDTINIEISAMKSSTVSIRCSATEIRVYQNDQLPIRSGTPYYAFSPDSPPEGCISTCQKSCQEACQNSCQSCEGSCETRCEWSCESGARHLAKQHAKKPPNLVAHVLGKALQLMSGTWRNKIILLCQ